MHLSVQRSQWTFAKRLPAGCTQISWVCPFHDPTDQFCSLVYHVVERRALFLAKVHAPPSPTATTTPKTPPDSPAIFHYSLPSPGLVSPLAMFDSLQGNAIPPCKSIEQVDFRLVHGKNIQVNHNQVLPSLDQISARLKTLASARSTTIVDGPVVIPALPPAPPLGRPATIEIGRLKMPVRSAKLLSVAAIEPPSQSRPATVAIPPPLIPNTSLRSDLEISTTVAQRTATASPAKLTESNLKILDARERRAHNMLSTLRRRTLSMPQQPSQPACLIDDTVPRSLTKDAARRTTPVPIPQEVMELGLEDRKPRWKRHSAPADFMPKGHAGFEHPVFAYPGAF